MLLKELFHLGGDGGGIEELNVKVLYKSYVTIFVSVFWPINQSQWIDSMNLETTNYTSIHSF